MDLLPSHEDLDNTGFRVTDKKSMLALIGDHSYLSTNIPNSVIISNK